MKPHQYDAKNMHNFNILFIGLVHEHLRHEYSFGNVSWHDICEF